MELVSLTVEPIASCSYTNTTDNNNDNDSLLLAKALADRSFDMGDDDDDNPDGKQHGDDDDEDEDTNDPFRNEQLFQRARLIDEVREIGMFAFIEKYVVNQNASLLSLLEVLAVDIPPGVPQTPLYLLRLLKLALTRALRNRQPLADYTTPYHAAALIQSSKRILILTGAGISTSCGIPDFRSPNSGLYSRLIASGKYSGILSDPQEMFDIEIFKEIPELFYDFAKEIYPSDDVRRCSRTHRWIKRLEKEGKLLRNYTQNIDTLEQTAGIEKVLYAHGSFATCSCLTCGTQFPGEAIKEDIYAQTVPLCPVCLAAQKTFDSPNKRQKMSNGKSSHSRYDEDEDENDYGHSPYHGKPLLKPDITFFGQALSDDFDKYLLKDREEVDLLIVIGTSLQVAPVSELLYHLPHRVPQILINRDPVPHMMEKMDMMLLGDCDQVVAWLEREVLKLGSTEARQETTIVSQGTAAAPTSPTFHVPSLPNEGISEHDEQEAIYDGPEPSLALPAPDHKPLQAPQTSLQTKSSVANPAPREEDASASRTSIGTLSNATISDTTLSNPHVPIILLPSNVIPSNSESLLSSHRHSTALHPNGISSLKEATSIPQPLDHPQPPEDANRTADLEGEEDEELDCVDNVWLFPGANTGHRWLKLMRAALDGQYFGLEQEEVFDSDEEDNEEDGSELEPKRESGGESEQESVQEPEGETCAKPEMLSHSGAMQDNSSQLQMLNANVQAGANTFTADSDEAWSLYNT